ncbi:MAG: Adaptive-response sensory-kinase SasA [Chroococcopsis gigantea SAG 12.99]|jgi:signal transduction histidine kinase|nr:MASE1 domain-containing protein [Chlorogloea purpurea SAG 13.99]MDV3001488.1 Adaptive-response sensory-kinase SasA [Chroococcopsis gigantea SAG 12.99]
MPVLNYPLKIFVVTIVYFATGWWGNQLLHLGIGPSPIWFPAGIGLSAVLLWGERQVLGIFLGDFFLGLTLSDNWGIIIASALGSGLSGGLGGRLLRQGHFSRRLNRIRDVLILVFGAGFLAATVNASIDSLAHFYMGGLQWQQFRQHWGILWLGDVAGICVLTPLLLRSIHNSLPLWKSTKSHLLEAIICNGLLLGIGWLVFGCEGIKPNLSGDNLSNVQYLEYLPFPFLVWAALRFPVWGAVIANLFISLLALVGMSKGVGPFMVQSPNLGDGLLLLQIFLIIITTTSLFLSAAVAEKEEIDKRLRSTLERLNSNLEREVAERTLELTEKMTELQNLHEMKTVFLQAVSHDMRTAIMGLLMILRNNSGRCQEGVTLAKPLLDKIIQSTERQLTLINAISENHFSEHRPLSIYRQKVYLQDMVKNWLDEWADNLIKNQANANNLIADDLPPIEVDSRAIKCVFEQLLNNALKHNQPGLSLSVDAQVKGDMLYCTFTDNGQGMSDVQCQHLFKLYVKSLHNQHLTGVGLGCYRCRQIIEAHGGNIGVSSIPDVGSQFWFTLPLAKFISYAKDLPVSI